MKHTDICSDIENLLADTKDGGAVTLGEIVRRLEERGFGFLMLLLVLPNCVPVPVPPGTSTIFSLPLLFFSVQMLVGRAKPWLPAGLLERRIDAGFLLKVIGAILPFMRRIQRCARPRFLFFSAGIGKKILGLWWLAFALSIAVPLPMTNFLPGIGILVTSFGLIYRDGYIIVTGLAVGCIGLLVTGGFLFMAQDILDRLF